MTSSLLFALTAPARAADCAKSADGQSVTCTADGFGLLTREAILARGEAKTCSIKLNEAQSAVESRSVMLAQCETALASIPPCPPPPGIKKPLVAYSIGVVSTAVVLASVIVPVPDAVKITAGVVGLAGLAGGVVVLVW